MTKTVKGRLRFIFVATALLFLVFVFFTNCSQQVSVNNKSSANIKISLKYPNVYTQKLQYVQKPFAFEDELPINKYRVVLKDTSENTLFENDFDSSNISFNISIVPNQEYILEVQAYTNSVRYESETMIMKGTQQTILVSGTNNVTIPLEFELGRFELEVSLDSEVNSEYRIGPSELIMKHIARGTEKTYNHTNNNLREDTYSVENVYPGMWHVTYKADIVQDGVVIKNVELELAVPIYPVKTTKANALITRELGINADISITAILPYLPQVKNLIVYVMGNSLDVSYEYQVEGVVFYIYKRYKNENFWRIAGTTNEKTYTVHLMPGELDKIELIGVNAVSNGRESGLTTIASIDFVKIMKWRYKTGSLIHYSSPAIGQDGTIYVGSWDRYLYAIRSNGALKWKFLTGNPIESSPAIGEDGTIYIGSDGLYAIKSDGTLRWKFETGGNVWSSPAIGEDGTIYFGSWDRYLYAINSDGTLKWRYQTGGEIVSSPAIDEDGTIYVGSIDNYLYAINPDGTLKWRFETNGWVRSSPSIGLDGTVYVGTSGSSTKIGYLYAIDSTDGSLKWSFETGPWGIHSSPVIGEDGTVYVESDDSYLYAIMPNGTLKWKFQTVGGTQSGPAIGKDGTIYTGSDWNYLYAINPDGTLKWRFKAGDTVWSSPAIGEDGTIYFGSWDGYIYAIQSDSYGLANSPWPKFKRDNRNTGKFCNN